MSNKQLGGTVLGFLSGLIIGLVIAVAVAIFVTRAPVPFVNKVGKTDRVNEAKTAADAPDPNKPLYGKTKPPAVTPAPETPAAVVPPPAAPVTPASGSAPVVASAPSTAPAATPGTEEKIAYLLQAGAFRSEDDALGMKGRLALIGYQARILTAEVKGETLYRVRVGPYPEEAEATKVRSKLAESGIDATIVRQR